MKFYINNLDETKELAQKVASLLSTGMVILLDGPLGSGKTTFTQAIGRNLGIKRAIKSPTYTIVKEYPLNDQKFIHIDAYRLEDGGADTIDLVSYLKQNGIILIEWSEFLEEYLPLERIRISFKVLEDIEQREIEIVGENLNSEAYINFMNKIGEWN